MDRRKALSITTTIIGGTIIGSEMFLSGCSVEENLSKLFTDKDLSLLDEIGETILPESDRSPGAKSAQIGTFMQKMVIDFYKPEEAKIFKSGLRKITEASELEYGENFLTITPAQRQDLLTEFDRIARSDAENETPHFFAMMKQLTIWGYFSSEVGATQALRYNPIPGRYDGCIPYHPGDPAWA